MSPPGISWNTSITESALGLINETVAVDSQVEQAQFAENAVRYQSTLTFLNGKFRGLRLAIKGE